MKAWGPKRRSETFDVLFPTPKSRSLELLGPKPYTAGLTEPPVEEMPPPDRRWNSPDL